MSLCVEVLESRFLCCGGSPVYDVTHDSWVSPADVAAVIQSINSEENLYKPLDALRIINEINLCGPKGVTPVDLVALETTPKYVGTGYGVKIAELGFYIPAGRVLDVQLRFQLNTNDIELDSVVTRHGQLKIKENIVWLKLDGNGFINVISNMPSVTSIGKELEFAVIWDSGSGDKDISFKFTVI